ncbi:hypothetical protein PDIG_72290 [Penicillium digitatum PHI26]|uniref:Uncharacterized protein n=2 Tax=Penicillium digitatum TaxID=36651 RepID=K9G2W6_PEND2|nr:hypothetical protein PDIP_81560 [Penicillium digitatum Pd1]EKV05760.1 hypothetical protein PDIP_81560 [Penicillium digitatum Pd1]EKV07616.1 hypothetical protein PDIG_72290 [Penicillium digitatum PHI26]
MLYPRRTTLNTSKEDGLNRRLFYHIQEYRADQSPGIVTF